MSRSSEDIFTITEVLHWCLRLHNLNCLVTMPANNQIRHQLNTVIKRAIFPLPSNQNKTFSPERALTSPSFKEPPACSQAQKRGVPERYNEGLSRAPCNDQFAKREGCSCHLNRFSLSLMDAMLQEHYRKLDPSHGQRGFEGQKLPYHLALVLVPSVIFSSFSLGSSQ